MLDLLTHSLLPFIGILLTLLVVHEAAHYFTAKWFGVKVLEAGIGLPPKIWGFRWRDTDYTLNAFPFGAFVRMLGEEDPTDPASLAAQPKWKRTIIIGSGAFTNVVLAIAIFTVALMIPREVSDAGAVIGEVTENSPAANAQLRNADGDIIGRGLEEGDEVIEVNGHDIDNTTDVVYRIRLAQGSDVDFKIRRTEDDTGPQIYSATAYARWDPPSYTDECGLTHSGGMTGIKLGPKRTYTVSREPGELAELERDSKKAYASFASDLDKDLPACAFSPTEFGFRAIPPATCAALDPDEQAAARALKRDSFPLAPGECYEFRPGPAREVPTKMVSYPLWEAAPRAVQSGFENLILTRNQVWKLMRGFDAEPLTGPVGIAHATGEIVDRAGWRYLIEFSGALSLGLGILNFLPIPMVDGGRLMFIFIEFLRRGKRIAPEKEALVHLVGFVGMITLFLVIGYFDAARWIRGDSLLQ